MHTIFDAATTHVDAWFECLFPLAALALAAWLFKTSEKRLYWKLALGLSVFLAGIAVLYPWLDHRRIQDLLARNEVQVTEGVVTGHKRWTERRFDRASKGVGVTTTFHYTNTTYEYFYVGNQAFSYVVSSYPTFSSFTNSGDPPVKIVDGMRARVTWFKDSWNDGDVRIVRMAIGPGDGRPVPVVAAAAALTTAAAAPADLSGLPADFAAFWSKFSSAMAKGDAVQAKALTHFPFMFGGHDLGADEFDSLWMSIFAAPQRPCLAGAQPKADGDRYSVFCGPYGYYFAKMPEGWRLVEFGADGEAM